MDRYWLRSVFIFVCGCVFISLKSFSAHKNTKKNLNNIQTSRSAGAGSSSETQGQLVGVRGNKSGKEMKRHMFTSKAKKAPGNRLLSDHFQTALPMLPPDWAEKSFVLFCPIGEQQLAGYCGVFLHDSFCIAILAWFCVRGKLSF